MPGILSGNDCIAHIRSQTDTILLAFSCGKDSIAAWLECRKHFPRIVPYYMYLIPGLEFVERSLTYYEEWFGCRIMRYPHPTLYHWLSQGTFQAPERIPVIRRFGLPTPDYSDLQQIMRDYLALGPTCYTASGVRAVDSPQRMMALRKYGPISESKKQFFPVWDWNKARLLSEITSAGINLPVDYRIFGRSFDGLDYRFLAPIKQHFPADYARIIDWFPLAQLELHRRAYAQIA